MSNRMAVGHIPGERQDNNARASDSQIIFSNNSVQQYPLVPSVVGGYNFTSQRPHVDKSTQCVVLSSDKSLFYFDIKSGRKIAIVYPELPRRDEHLVWCERLQKTLFVCSNTGRLGLWHLAQREWLHYNQLPLQQSEVVVAFRLISPTKVVYATHDPSKTPDTVVLFIANSQSIREPFKKRQAIRSAAARPNAFDVGVLDPSDSDQGCQRHYIASCVGHKLRVHETLARGADPDKSKLRSAQHYVASTEFTCVRANPKQQMIAVGDTIGRVFVYFDDIFSLRPTRATLHWHQLPINDLCYSSKGNVLFSVGGETGAVVCWELNRSLIGQKLVITRLGMPIRYLNYNGKTNQLITCHTDNTVQILEASIDTNVGCLRNFTRGQIHDNVKNLKYNFGIRWHSTTDCIVTNELPGVLQFYSPHRGEHEYLLDLLQLNPPSYEREHDIYQSDITQLAISPDGEWIAIIESFENDSKGMLPQVRLKIWNQDENNQWKWIMTEDRPHQGYGVKDLRFSDNSKYLVSVGADQKFRIWYRVSNKTTHNANRLASNGDDSTNSTAKPREQVLFARGFTGNLEGQNPIKACFTEDSSLLGLAVNNSTIALWTVESGSKLRYETQLGLDMNSPNSAISSVLLDMAFGHEQCSHMLCDVRSSYVNVWSILDPSYKWEYTLNNDVVVAAAFDQGEDLNENNFVLITKNNNVLLFNLESLGQEPLMKLQLTDVNVTHAVFVGKPISERLRDLTSVLENSPIIKALSRLCILNRRGELLCFDDKLKLEQHKSQVTFDRLDSLDVSELGQFLKISQNRDDSTIMDTDESMESAKKKIKLSHDTVDIDKLFETVSSHVLPRMDVMSCLILETFVRKKSD